MSQKGKNGHIQNKIRVTAKWFAILKIELKIIDNFNFSDADLEERTRIERQEIVARYDLGRDEGAKIDDWEDPKLEVYHKQDRWGFIQ